MQEFLSDFGTVETEFEIAGEVHSVDVHFVPNPDSLPAPIGHLGRMIAETCLIEAFRNAVSGMELCNCRTKSNLLGNRLFSQAKREKYKFRFADRPFLWIITPTLSKQMQKEYSMCLRADWGEGIYFLPEGDRAAVVSVHQLPETPETLWLRLLGRDEVQKRAVAELMALPKDYPYRVLSLRHIAVLQKNLRARQNLSKDLRTVIMALSITYEQIEAELLTQGRNEGIETGLEEGRMRRSQEIAIAMLREGMEPELVARLTQLAIEQLPRLDSETV